MYLGSINKATKHYDWIRKLRPDEVAEHKKHTRSIVEARDRLALFRMLDRNYADWRGYLNRLLSADFKEQVDVSEELNRLLLNYLTLAYAIQEHFCVSYRQRFRKNPEKLQQYSKFIDRLCAKSWAFAFVLDYRGHVQHVELGIYLSNRIADETSVRIQVVANAKTLVAASRGWKRSRLTAERRDIHLVSILREFHTEMLQSYRPFVAKMFFPELNPASAFYARLSQEVQKRDRAAGMVLFSKELKLAAGKGGKASGKVDIEMVPNDVFAELGIKVQNRQHAT